MYREYGQWRSPALDRTMEFLWFGKFGRPVLFFPTSSGRFYECEDMGLAGSLADKVEGGEIQLVLVDSVDQESWWDKSLSAIDRAARHVQYDAYLRNEIVPYVFKRAQRGDLVVYGGEFGAYHAANFAARYPDVVSRAICFSGIYTLESVIQGCWDENCYFNCPASYIPNMDAEWVGKLSRVSWTLGAGEYDPDVQQSRDFAHLLSSKSIPHEAEFWPGGGGRDWGNWREHLRRFL